MYVNYLQRLDKSQPLLTHLSSHLLFICSVLLPVSIHQEQRTQQTTFKSVITVLCPEP